MSELRAIAYLSTATHLMSEQELEGLLGKARKQNLESGITGVLLYCEGSFMQCLEGEAAAVAQTYQRIGKSRLHTGIIELMDESIAVRSFADWRMGYSSVTSSEFLLLETAQWKQRLENTASSAHAAPAGLALLRQFWANAQR